MEEVIFPPSPNWFLPHVLDVATDGTICYGTNSSIAVLRVAAVNGDRLKISSLDIIPHAHRERVSVVSFGPPGGFEKMIATIGGDSYVKVWDVQTGLMCQMHQHHGVSAKIRGMDWSSANRQLVVSVDESGTFVLFDVGANKSDTVTFPKLHATVIACCPHKWQWVAVGDFSGLVLIVNIGSGSVLHKMRGHDNPIVSLSWSPVTGNVFLTGYKAADTNEMLLASGASSRNAFVWRAGTDGRCQMEISQQTGLLGQPKPRVAGTAAGTSKGYAAVFWAQPTKLLTSTVWGELICWDLVDLATWQRANDKIAYNPQQKTAGKSILTTTNQRGLFSIACLKMRVPRSPDSNSTDWRKKEEEPLKESPAVVWTTSQDRQLVASDLAGNGARLEVPTLGGFVYCMALSKLDCHKVAIGAGDGTIRVWNMSTLTTIDLRSIWLKIKGRVTAMAWHPSNDSWLAYGTSEGRVGIYDMANTTRGPIHIWSFHKKSVYGLGWGPVAAKRGVTRKQAESRFLYSCGDNMLLCYNLNQEQESLEDVSTQLYVNKEPIAANVTEFAWKDDYSVVAIGTDNGCVHLCTSPNLDVIATMNPHKKLIHCLQWHPMVTTTEPTGSKYSNFLAFASTENTVKIYDFEKMFAGEESALATSSFTTISGHSERVTHVAWNPHVGGMLVTASYDGSAQVWDVRGGEVKLLALFADHGGWVVCVKWCPMHADYIITGSSDFTLRLWRVSSQDTKKRAKPLVMSQPPTEPGLPAASINKRKTAKSSPITTSAPKAANATGADTSTASGPGRMPKTHFPVSSRSRNVAKDLVLASTYCLLEATKMADLGEETDTPTIDVKSMAHIGFFAGQDVLDRMMDMEGSQLIESNVPEHAQNIALWKSTDFEKYLEKAMLEKKVTLWHIAIAPFVSARMWRVLVRSYAEQLQNAGRLQEAATMMISIGMVEEAVEMLLAEKLFREAVCIVRCHLSEDNPLRQQAFAEWAKHSEIVGDYELATQCHIAVRDFSRAAQTQGHRKDSKSLDLAVTLAEAAGDDKLAFTLGEQTILKLVMDRNYKRALIVATKNKELWPWIWLIITHEEMMASLDAMGKDSFAVRSIKHWLSREENVTGATRAIEKRCNEEFSLSETEASIILNGIDGNPKTKHEVQMNAVAYTAACLAAKDEDTKLIYLVKAFEVCYRYHLLFPRSRQLLPMIMATMPAPNAERQTLPTGPHISIDGFVCAGLLRWIDQESSSAFLINDSDEKTSVVLEKIVEAITCFLPTALDTRVMFYYNAVSQYGKYERMILEQKRLEEKVATNVKDDTAKTFENGVHVREEGDSFENGLSKLSLDDESKDVTQCPITTLRRLRKFEVFFNQTRVAAPNPYFLRMDLVKVLTQYQEKINVQKLLENLSIAWAKKESHIAHIWTMVANEPGTLFGTEDNDPIPTEFWDSIQIRDQAEEF